MIVNLVIGFGPNLDLGLWTRAKPINILTDNVTKDLPVRVILQNTEVQFIRDLDILADYVAKNLPARVFFQNTEVQFIRDLDILADNVAKN